MTTSPACSALTRCSPPLSGGLWRRRAPTARSPRGQHRERDRFSLNTTILDPATRTRNAREVRPPSQMPIHHRTPPNGFRRRGTSESVVSATNALRTTAPEVPGPEIGEEQGVAAGIADLLLLEHGHGDAPRPSV
jgi:hypothetical protein